jgi:hypothetical protein
MFIKIKLHYIMIMSSLTILLSLISLAALYKSFKDKKYISASIIIIGIISIPVMIIIEPLGGPSLSVGLVLIGILSMKSWIAPVLFIIGYLISVFFGLWGGAIILALFVAGIGTIAIEAIIKKLKK